MKKILTIGDLHGKNIWKNFADIDILLKSNGDFDPDYDYYIFIGDYTDAFDKTNKDIFDNLTDIIKFKKLYPNNVILLLGNHDIQYYLANPFVDNKNEYKYFCTGFRVELHFDLYDLFNKNKNLFQLAFQYDNYLWTHAGIHKGWYLIFEKEFNKLINIYDTKFDTLADKLNIAFEHKLDCLFDIGFRRGGNKKIGGPFWIDKELTYKKPLDDYHQIVGHTYVNEIKTYKKNNNTSITFIDVLNIKDEFYNLIIE